MEKNTKRDTQATSALIQQTAIRLMQAKGYEGTSTRDIARESGVGLSTLFHYFGSKSELLERTLKSEFDYLLGRMHAATDDVADPVERLSAAIRVHVVLHCDKPESMIVQTELRSLDPVPRAEVQVLAEQVHEIFAGAITAGARSGAFDCERPRDAARAIHSMCSGVTSWFRPGGERSAEDVAQDYVGFALRLLGARQPTRPSGRRLAATDHLCEGGL